MHMKVREDIDTGRGMLRLEEAENPKSLQDLVDKAVAVLNTLRSLQLKVTFENLGLNVQDGCSSKNVQTDDTITELAEQYTNSQVFKNACVSEGAICDECIMWCNVVALMQSTKISPREFLTCGRELGLVQNPIHKAHMHILKGNPSIFNSTTFHYMGWNAQGPSLPH